MTNETSHATLRQFLSEIPYYATLIDGAVQLLRVELPRRGVHPYKITARLKSLSSTLDKITRKGKNLAQITDRAGVRITCRHTHTVDDVLQVIETLFVVDEIEDTALRHRSSDFGYAAKHCIVHWSPNRDGPFTSHHVSHAGPRVGGLYYVSAWRYRGFPPLPMGPDQEKERVASEHIQAINQSIASLPLEIQIRTILQDAWANVSNELLYKSPIPIADNLNVRQRMARLAAILKETDRAFQEELDRTPSTQSFQPGLGDWISPEDRKLTEEFLEAYASEVLGIEEPADGAEFALKRLLSVGVTTESQFQRLMIACIAAIDASFSSIFLRHLRFLNCYVEALVHWCFEVTELTLVPAQVEVIDRNRDLVDEQLLHDVLRDIKSPRTRRG